MFVYEYNNCEPEKKKNILILRLAIYRTKTLQILVGTFPIHLQATLEYLSNTEIKYSRNLKEST